MLHEGGGMRITGNAHRWAYEDDRTADMPRYTKWMRELTPQHVVKDLKPHMTPLPQWFRCQWIWIDRDPADLVPSQKKFVRWKRKRDPKYYKAKWRKMDPVKERAVALRYIEKHGGRVLFTTFAELIQTPLAAAEKLAAFCGIDAARAPAMASHVIERPVTCLPGMMEDSLR
jgi:hypothetical protein